MNANDVLHALGALTRFWPRRPDTTTLDIVVEFDALAHVLAALAPLGFRLAEDFFPTRAVLRSSDGRQIDLHPVVLAEDGTGWQRRASPDGSDLAYPAEVLETVGTAIVRGAVSEAVRQLERHRGYEPTDKDFADMARLAERFYLVLPAPY